MSSWAQVVGSSLKETFSSQTDPDFALTCTDGDVRCHRLILLSNGGVLAARVKERLADNVARLDVAKLGLTKDDVKAIVTSLYGGLENEMTSSNALQFVKFALHFEIKWLMNEVIGKFKSLLTVKNVLLFHRETVVNTSNHLTKTVENFCRENINSIVDETDFLTASEGGVRLILKHAESSGIDTIKVFRKVMEWLLSSDDNLKSSGTVVSLIPLQNIPKPALQAEVYNLLFNKVIIGKSDFISKEDKVLLSSLYQKAVATSEKEDTSAKKMFETAPARVYAEVKRQERPAEVLAPIRSELRETVPGDRQQTVPPTNQRSETIFPHIRSRSWSNMGFQQV